MRSTCEARRILDADHFGLEPVKKRILEYLAVRKLNPEGHGPILCSSAAGVGKTSLAERREALGRKFVRVSLGGVHDRPRYAAPAYLHWLAAGNIIQAIKKAGTRNCVMMLDEVDKLGAGFHGDPSSALLEVLDPAQNNTFATTISACLRPFAGAFHHHGERARHIPVAARPHGDHSAAGLYAGEKLEIARRYS